MVTTCSYRLMHASDAASEHASGIHVVILVLLAASQACCDTLRGFIAIQASDGHSAALQLT